MLHNLIRLPPVTGQPPPLLRQKVVSPFTDLLWSLTLTGQDLAPGGWGNPNNKNLWCLSVDVSACAWVRECVCVCFQICEENNRLVIIVSQISEGDLITVDKLLIILTVNYEQNREKYSGPLLRLKYQYHSRVSHSEPRLSHNIQVSPAKCKSSHCVNQVFPVSVLLKYPVSPCEKEMSFRQTYFKAVCLGFVNREKQACGLSDGEVRKKSPI